MNARGITVTYNFKDLCVRVVSHFGFHIEKKWCAIIVQVYIPMFKLRSDKTGGNIEILLNKKDRIYAIRRFMFSC